MNSSIDAGMLPPGFFARSVNLRYRQTVPVVRDGCVKINSGNPAGATACVGAWSGTANGGVRTYAAFWNGSDVRVYRFDSGVYTELTTASTRFTNNLPVGFEVIAPNRFSGLVEDAVIFGNGTEANRLCDGFNSSSTVVLVQPIKLGKTTQAPVPHSWLVIGAGVTKVESDSADLALDISTATTLGPLLTIPSTSNASATVSLLADEVGTFDSGSFATANVGRTIANEVALVLQTSQQDRDAFEYLSDVSVLTEDTTYTAATITNATNASPIVVTTSAAHGLANGEYVNISGVTGNLAANGTFVVAGVTATTFELVGTTGSGAWVSGGTVRRVTFKTLWANSGSYGIRRTKAIKGTDSTVPSVSSQSLFAGGATIFNSIPEAQVLVFDAGDRKNENYWCGIRFTATGSTPAAAVSARILSVFSTGYKDPENIYAVSAAQGTSTLVAESVPCVKSAGAAFQTYGGVANASRFKYSPSDNLSYTNWQITAWRVNTTDDSAVIFESVPTIQGDGDVGYTVFAQVRFLTFDFGVGLPTQRLVSTQSRDTSRLAYEPGDVIPPNGSLFVTLGSRLMVSGQSGNGKSGEVWISYGRDPLRFRQVALFDETGVDSRSGTVVNYVGESVNALQRRSTSQYGVDVVRVFTNQRLARLSGYDAASLSQTVTELDRGLFARNAFASSGEITYFLDSDGQIRKIGNGSTDAISVMRMDATLAAATITSAVGSAGSDWFELHLTISGDTGNQSGIHYDAYLNEFSGLDRFPFAVSQSVSVPSSPRRVTYVFTATGDVWELFRYGQTTENGAGIAAEIRTREFEPTNVTQGTFRRPILYADALSTDVTCNIESPQPNKTANGRFRTSASSDTREYIWAGTTATGRRGAPMAAFGPGIQIFVSGTFPGGWKLRAMAVEFEPKKPGGRGA